jgi:ribose 5-phosphate isomerase A
VSDAEREKRVAARAAAGLVEDGMTVGLGTGSTVAHLLDALAERGLGSIRCVATSVATELRARELGLPVEPFDRLDRLDIAIDGTDQVDPAGRLVKGGGGAHTREKIAARAADRFVVIADASKAVDALTAPVPLELLAYGLRATVRALGGLDVVTLRDAPRSPDDGVIADWHGELDDPDAVAARLSATPGVVDHGLFPAELVADVLIARGDEVEHRSLR